MNELRIGVRELAHEEVNRANEKHPLFASSHEAFGVILEEVEETVDALKKFNEKNAKFWALTKKDGAREKKCMALAEARMEAVEVACEAIQVVAMCDKAIISMYNHQPPAGSTAEGKGSIWERIVKFASRK